ncbi:hypothetical protein DIPPA_10873 [Diplonema papillatum]|nr:hypothetical protein DIPPA_10873 [Diplonema papillatum]
MCCPAGALGFLAPDHKEQGRKEDLDGVAAYISGELRDKVVIAVSDVWGWNTGRIRAIADGIADAGGACVIPRLLDPVEGGFDGDGLPPTWDMAQRRGELPGLFGGPWRLEAVVPKVRQVLAALASRGVSQFGLVGFCYGGWVSMEVSTLGDLPVRLVGGVLCHPSNHIDPDPAAQAARSKCPWLILPAGDPAKQMACDPAIYDEGGAVFQALDKNFPGGNKTVRFPRQPHGWLARGNIKLPVTGAVIGGEGVEEDVKRGLELVFARLREYGLIGDDCA